MDLVTTHIKKVDSNLYLDLFKQNTKESRRVANDFTEGSQEIKKSCKTSLENGAIKRTIQ